MDENWNIPTALDIIPKDINYIISMDESGSCSYTSKIHELIKENRASEIDENRRYFTLCAVIFTKQNYQHTRKDINDLKNKYWKNGMYEYKNKGLQKVCFHTSDINNKRGCFSPEAINMEKFIIDLSLVLEKAKCIVIAITMDLYQCVLDGHVNDVYEFAFRSILQRYIYFAPNKSKAIIVLESRGKKEDAKLLREIKPTFFVDGLQNISSEELLEKVTGVFFNHKWRDSSHTYSGLEIADLFAYPIYRYEKNGIRGKDFEIIYKKFYGYPHRIKFGLMNYPKK